MPASDLDLATVDHLLTTTRSVRKRLDLERPVPLALVEECLEIALQAPSGSNSQGWEILAITDPAKRAAIAKIYADSLGVYARGEAKSLVAAGLDSTKGYAAGDKRNEGMDRILGSAMHLCEILHRVPVHVLFCAPTRLDGADTLAWASVLGSILPAAWSFMLAARARGLGTAWTTIHLVHEQASHEALGVPAGWTQLALLPVAWYRGETFHPGPRRPLRDVLHWNEVGEHERPGVEAKPAP